MNSLNYVLLTILFAFSSLNFAHAQECASHTSSYNNGPVKVTVYSETGECFSMQILNQTITPQNVNQVVFHESEGIKKVLVTMASGAQIKKSMAINPDYKTVFFKIKQNKKGKYVMNLQPFAGENNGPTAQELMEKAKADREARDAQRDKEEAEAKAEKERKKAEEERLAKEEEEKRLAQNNTNNNSRNSTNSNSSTNSSSNSNSSNSSSSTGSTKVRLKITNGGKPVTGSTISIGYKGNIIGKATTNSSGIAEIYTNGLISRAIDVYGQKGSDNWKLEGLITLDNNNYAEIDPTKAMEMLNNKIKDLEKLDEMDGDEILKSFGF